MHCHPAAAGRQLRHAWERRRAGPRHGEEKYAQYTATNAMVAQRHVTAMPPRIVGAWARARRRDVL